MVVDCPALTPWADSVALQEHLDGAILVLRSRHAKKESIKNALTHVRPGLLQGTPSRATRWGTDDNAALT